MGYSINKIFKAIQMVFQKVSILNRDDKGYKKISVFLSAVLFFTCFGVLVPTKADVLPGLMYNSKVIYIGNDNLNNFTDRLNKYTDSCWTPSKNTTGWTVKYQVVEGEDIITVEKNGKITVTGKGIGKGKVKVTYSKKGSSNVTAFFTVKVRRNAAHVRLTTQSIEILSKPVIVGETITFNAAKSYDGSYKTGHYGLNNYMGVISDNLKLESMTPSIIETDGFTITAKAAGIGKFVVKAYQYSDDKFTGIQSQVYTIEVKEADLPDDSEEPKPTPIILPDLSEMDILFMERVVQLTNIEREKEGLSNLVMDNDLSKVALIRSMEIVSNSSHIRDDGKSFNSLLDEYNIGYKEAGENIAYGYKTPEDVVKAWMDSEEHRQNILHDNFTSIGIGVNTVDNIIYWVQLFVY